MFGVVVSANCANGVTLGFRPTMTAVQYVSILWGWVVALFGGACLLVVVAEIGAQWDHHGGAASLRRDNVVVVGDVV